jgi:hypothetical protein
MSRDGRPYYLVFTGNTELRLEPQVGSKLTRPADALRVARDVIEMGVL